LGQFSRFINFEVGSGTNIWLWHDWWWGNEAWRDLYLDLYSITKNQESAVAGYLHWITENTHWDITFMRDIQDWQMDMLIAFLDPTYSTKIRKDAEDQIY
jgi:hypothetical protein